MVCAHREGGAAGADVPGLGAAQLPARQPHLRLADRSRGGTNIEALFPELNDFHRKVQNYIII